MYRENNELFDEGKKGFRGKAALGVPHAKEEEHFGRQAERQSFQRNSSCLLFL